jgi:inosine-uridine nucleoside N-ribohydrolase
VGDFLRRRSVRWCRRSLLRRGSRRFPVFDLAAAAYAIDPARMDLEETRIRLHSNLWVEYGAGDRKVRVVREIDAEGIWRRFTRLIQTDR